MPYHLATAPTVRVYLQNTAPGPLKSIRSRRYSTASFGSDPARNSPISCFSLAAESLAMYSMWDLQVQYGWLFGRPNYPGCAEKLKWAWGLAADRLLLQLGLVILATVALTVA